MKSTFWMTVQEAEDEIKSREIVCGIDGCLFHDPTGTEQTKAFGDMGLCPECGSHDRSLLLGPCKTTVNKWHRTEDR